WSQLSVRTNPKYPDLMQAYAAGYIEGIGTKSLIADNWFNTVEGMWDMCTGKTKFCANLKKFLEANLAYMMRMIKDNNDSQYWKQIELNLMQLQGMEDAYYGKVMNLTSNLHLKPFGLTLLNINGDIETLEDVLDDTDHINHDSDHMIGSGSCSALIKLLGNSELLAAHSTWSGYNTMLRIIKKYELNYRDIKGELIPGHTSSFSSYPGQIFSGDDFYILSSGLTTIETTISNSNQKLWKYVKSDTVLEWLRNLAANQMARSGVEWSSIFALHNSGTKVVDYNKFTPGIEPQPGLLYVLEQLPGLIVYKDVTNVLKRQTYWASYNSPYYPKVFNASGLPALVKKYGPWFTHDRTPRALIFARNHSSVTDIHKMLKLMRYNNFQHDPLSSCNCTPPYSGENAIAARSDLNLAQGEYPLPALSQRNHGATDVKITSSSLHRNYEMIAECGPTHDQQPVFKWSTSPYFNLPHRGMPDSFDFQPIHVKWD
uniref:Phospholipase B-like n=1 Tax=Ciona savignyi TaxID=51511 RepID=H2YHB7_CIOSA